MLNAIIVRHPTYILDPIHSIANSANVNSNLTITNKPNLYRGLFNRVKEVFEVKSNTFTRLFLADSYLNM